MLAWIVVAAHITWYTGVLTLQPKLGAINRLGQVAVLVFVIISGFLIANLIIEKNESYRDYIFRRALRIFPVYGLCLLLGIATTFLTFGTFAELWGPDSPQTADLQRQIDSLEGRGLWFHLLAHLTLMHGAIPDNIRNCPGS